MPARGDARARPWAWGWPKEAWISPKPILGMELQQARGLKGAALLDQQLLSCRAIVNLNGFRPDRNGLGREPLWRSLAFRAEAPAIGCPDSPSRHHAKGWPIHRQVVANSWSAGLPNRALAWVVVNKKKSRSWMQGGMSLVNNRGHPRCRLVKQFTAEEHLERAVNRGRQCQRCSGEVARGTVSGERGVQHGRICRDGPPSNDNPYGHPLTDMKKKLAGVLTASPLADSLITTIGRVSKSKSNLKDKA